MSVVEPYFIIFYVLSAEITRAEGTVWSINIELNHKSLIANKVPFEKILLNPLTSAFGRLA